MKYVLNPESDICCHSNLEFHINFKALEVVCRGSETQLHVTENLIDQNSRG